MPFSGESTNLVDEKMTQSYQRRKSAIPQKNEANKNRPFIYQNNRVHDFTDPTPKDLFFIKTFSCFLVRNTKKVHMTIAALINNKTFSDCNPRLHSIIKRQSQRHRLILLRHEVLRLPNMMQRSIKLRESRVFYVRSVKMFVSTEVCFHSDFHL